MAHESITGIREDNVGYIRLWGCVAMFEYK